MLALVAVIAMAPKIAPACPWALDFAAAGDFLFTADLNGDGYADLVRVSPSNDAFIDTAINGEGYKSITPQRSLDQWGKNCQAAAMQGKSVLGLFDGKTIRIATDFDGHRFAKNDVWLSLPNKLDKPHLQTIGTNVLVWSASDGKGWNIDGTTRAEKEVSLPKGTAWVGTDEVRMDDHGAVYRKNRSVGKMTSGVPVQIGADLFVSKSSGDSIALPSGDVADWAAGDMDHDGDLDLVEFRHMPDPHDGGSVLLFRTISPGETDSDHDGLTNDEEIKLGTDPYNPDTDNDTLLDGWEVGSYRGLDMKALGCDPRHVDLICLISPFKQMDDKFMHDQMAQVIRYYSEIDSPNPDGTKGWHLHPIYLDKIDEEDQKNGWPENRAKFRPEKWKGIVHWMQISPAGGGQADQLGDGGGCGGGGWALYATFIHEFGHQLGLSHEGFYGPSWCPTYPSLMNYAYSYGYEGDIKKVRYSDGRLASYVIHENDLSEVIPLPYDKVKFLADAPYHYRLKPDGDKTLIDWNWDGIFGEEHIRADINYAYSTTAGRRDEVDKTQSAPWLLNHGGRAYLFFVKHKFPADRSTDPTVSAEKPGTLYMRRLIAPFKWEDAVVIEKEGVIGNPVAASYDGRIFVSYPTKSGVVMRQISTKGAGYDLSDPVSLDTDSAKEPSLATFRGRLLLSLWDPATKETRYRWWSDGKFGADRLFGFISNCPLGMAEDTIRKQLIVGLMADEDDRKTSRWQLRRFTLSGDTLFDRQHEWIEGDKGSSAGSFRPVVLFDSSKDFGPDGKTYYLALGKVSSKSPWSCVYVAESLLDKTVSGGWRVKRYYDEWTQSRSAPAAAWYGGDMIYAYRWVDGSQNDRDNILHVAYNGSGIEKGIMGDFNDIGFMARFGIRYSLIYMAE